MNSTPGNSADFDYLFKLLLIGNSGVGKSCMLLRFSENNFTSNFFNTIGVDFKIKGIQLDNKNVKLQIVNTWPFEQLKQWDTAGQDRFKTITSTYYRGAQGIMIVYDITDRESFDNIKSWMSEIDKYAQESVIRVLVGNKSDMNEKRKISYEEGQELAKSYGIMFLETSAKNSHNIDMVFQQMARIIMDKTVTSQDKPKEFTKLDKKKLLPSPQESSGCC